MRKITLFMAAMVALFVAVGCDNKPKEGKVITPGVEGLDTAENDSTIYGKLIDGGMNSMILLTDDAGTAPQSRRYAGGGQGWHRAQRPLCSHRL